MSENEENENPVMRCEEVCRILGIGKNTYYEWCRQNIIPNKRVSRRIIVPRKRFNGWLETKDQGGN